MEPSSWAKYGTAGWKQWLGAGCAWLLAIFFLVAGVWKILEPLTFATLVTQLLVPGAISVPFTLSLAVAETVAGVMLIVPRFRRWGALLAGLLLAAFVIYVGARYGELAGKECSCFPWIKRSVGPGFFIGDAIMLLMAVVAGWTSRAPEGRRGATLVMAAVSVFTLVSYGVTAARQTGIAAPAEITVDGKPYPLTEGRVFLFFFDPECSHCDAAARQMAGFRWKETKIVAIPTRLQQFGQEFITNSGLPAVVSNDVAPLRKIFEFVDPPYGVALENGRLKSAFPYFDDKEPRASLLKIDYIE